jgi:MFS transporter, PPP family, 3-phenylpropionic acid transporter
MPARIFSLRFSIFYAFMAIGAGIQLPFLPLWLHARGLTVGEIAIVVAGMTAIRILAVPLAAFVSDRYRNRRSVIIVCGFAAFAAFLMLAFATSFWLIFSFSLLASFCWAPVFPLAESFSVDGSAVHRIDYGRMRLWASLSFLTGSLGGGILLQLLSINSVVFLMAGAQGISALVGLLLPDDPEIDAQVLENQGPTNFARVVRFLMAGSFALFITAVGVGQASHAMLYSFGPVHWHDLGFDKFTIGCFWAISIAAEVLLFGFSQNLVNRFGAMNLIIIGILGGAFRWLVMANDFGLGITFGTQALHAVSFAMLHLGAMHYIRLNVPYGLRNSAQGLYAAMSGGVAMSAVMGLTGLLYEHLHGGTYLAMAGISLVALSFGLALKRLSPTSQALTGT